MSMMDIVEGEAYMERDSFNPPDGMSPKQKIDWLKRKCAQIIRSNSFSQVKKENYSRYAESLDEAIDFISGGVDYRKLTPKAKRIVMFLLSLQKAWRTSKFIEKKNVLNVLKFLDADLVPEFRRQIIVDFITKTPKFKPLQDWEKEIFASKATDTEVMYQTGRPFLQIQRQRRKLRKDK